MFPPPASQRLCKVSVWNPHILFIPSFSNKNNIGSSLGMQNKEHTPFGLIFNLYLVFKFSIIFYVDRNLSFQVLTF